MGRLEETSDQLRFLLAAGKMRHALELLNLLSTCRFTALYRFDQANLQNLVLIDRERADAPLMDTIPTGDSYCAFVQASGATFVVENSLDANQISPIDTGAELAGVAAAGALTINTMLADITAQYAQTKPWLMLAEGDLTGISSIMPQKRNPTGMVGLRTQASKVIGEAQTFMILAHNVAAGMGDYKGDQPDIVRLRKGFHVFADKYLRAEVRTVPRPEVGVALLHNGVLHPAIGAGYQVGLGHAPHREIAGAEQAHFARLHQPIEGRHRLLERRVVIVAVRVVDVEPVGAKPLQAALAFALDLTGGQATCTLGIVEA